VSDDRFVVDFLVGRNTLEEAMIRFVVGVGDAREAVTRTGREARRFFREQAEGSRLAGSGWTEFNSKLEIAGRLFRWAGAAGRFFLSEVDPRRFQQLAQGIEEARTETGRFVDGIRRMGQEFAQSTGIANAYASTMRDISDGLAALNEHQDTHNELLAENERLLLNLPAYQREVIENYARWAHRQADMTTAISETERVQNILTRAAQRMAEAWQKAKEEGLALAGGVGGVFDTESDLSPAELRHQMMVRVAATSRLSFIPGTQWARTGRFATDNTSGSRGRGRDRRAEAIEAAQADNAILDKQRNLRDEQIRLASDLRDALADIWSEQAEAFMRAEEDRARAAEEAAMAIAAAKAREIAALGDLKFKREESALAEAAARRATISGGFSMASAVASQIGSMIKDEGARAWIEALAETGRATASFATLDFAGGALHSLAAAQLFYAAGQSGRGGSGSGGRGGGGGQARQPRAPRVRDPQPAAAGGGGAINIILQGLPKTQAQLGRDMGRAMNRGARRNMGDRLDARWTGGRR